MSITARDKNGTVTRARRAGDGLPLDRRTARYFAVVRGTWSRGYARRADAEAAEREMQGAVEAGVNLTARTVTFAEFVELAWLPMIDAKLARGEIKAGTAGHYRMTLRSILPAIGERKLRDLQPGHLRKFYGDLTARGLAPKSVRNIHTCVSNILGLALADGYVLRNVAKGRDVAPSGGSAEMMTWTPEQARAFIDATRADRLHAAWRLAALTGMRRGEVLGLHWDAVGFDGATVRVERTLVDCVDTRGARFETPKTERSKRTIDIDIDTVLVLREHRKAQVAERLAAMGAWPDDGDEAGLCFTDEAGRPLTPRLFSDRFKRLAAKAGLPAIRFHDLRHTHATLLLRAGEPVHVVSARLGHATPSITLDVYAHVLRDQATGASEAAVRAIYG